jgi:hypothetical protein
MLSVRNGPHTMLLGIDSNFRVVTRNLRSKSRDPLDGIVASGADSLPALPPVAWIADFKVCV